jgi:hypothetical protein
VTRAVALLFVLASAASLIAGLATGSERWVWTALTFGVAAIVVIVALVARRARDLRRP